MNPVNKLTIEDVQKHVNHFQVTLLSTEYINSHTPLDLKCKCGTIFKRTFSKLKDRSCLCINCTKELKIKQDHQNFQTEYKDKLNEIMTWNIELCTDLSKIYRVKDKIDFICNCGKKDSREFRYFKHGMCSKCSRQFCGQQNKTYKEVKLLIETDSKCKMITEFYTGRLQDLELLCACGNIFITKLERFTGDNKKQCNSCSINRRKGEGNPNWRGGVTPEIQLIRHSSEYKQWRDNVFKRDYYTCQCCLDSTGGNLQAHHIDNFSEFEDKRFDTDNGITLCNKCHDFRFQNSFHHKYGTRDNNIFQLQEYFDDIRSKLGLPLIQIETIINRNS